MLKDQNSSTTPKLITMLTYKDVTIPNAIDVFSSHSDMQNKFWGFKNVGLPTSDMKILIDLMKAKKKTIFLEVVTLNEEKCLEGARLSLEYEIDYLIGTIYYPSVHKMLENQPVKYFPFCGNVNGHPSLLHGSVKEIIADGIRMQDLGVDGFDLLAYRYTGDIDSLVKTFMETISIPVIMAGSISDLDRLNTIKKVNPWAFTIGSAFFDL